MVLLIFQLYVSLYYYVLHGKSIPTASSRVKNSALILSCQLKFVHDLGHTFTQTDPTIP